MKMINGLVAEETSSVNLVLRLTYSVSDSVLPLSSKILIAHVCRETIANLLEDLYSSTNTSRWKPQVPVASCSLGFLPI